VGKIIEYTLVSVDGVVDAVGQFRGTQLGDWVDDVSLLVFAVANLPHV